MKKYRYTYLSIIILTFGFFFISCSNDKKKLSRDKMIDVLHDMQIADAVYQNRYQNFNNIENKKALLDGVLLKHNITQAQLDSSLVWYADHPEEYMRITDSVAVRLKRESQQINLDTPNSLRKDRFNNSLLPYYAYLTEDNSFLAFYIDSIKAKDFSDFEISLKSLGLHGKIDAEITIHFEYKDTIITRSQIFTDELSPKIVNPTTTDTLKAISGFVYADSPLIRDYNVLLYDINLKGSKDLEKEKNPTKEVDNTEKTKEN